MELLVFIVGLVVVAVATLVAVQRKLQYEWTVAVMVAAALLVGGLFGFVAGRKMGTPMYDVGSGQNASPARGSIAATNPPARPLLPETAASTTGIVGRNFGAEPDPEVSATGIYAVEHNPDGRQLRWTNGHAIFTIPPIQTDRPKSLRIDVVSFRPTSLKIVLDGKVIATSRLPVGEWNRVLPVGGFDFKRRVTLELVSGTFTPTAVDGFTRVLGVQVFEARFQ